MTQVSEVRTHRNLLLLNFVVTFQDQDDFQYYSFKGLKKILSRRDVVRIIQAVKSNPRAYSDTGVNFIRVSSVKVHTVQWSY